MTSDDLQKTDALQNEMYHVARIYNQTVKCPLQWIPQNRKSIMSTKHDASERCNSTNALARAVMDVI